jgi:hypothetical protein
VLTSYMMNGAVNAFGRADSLSNVSYFRPAQFQADDLLFWEQSDGGGAAAWNDGAANPLEGYDPKDPSAGGLTRRHGDVAAVGCFDGHAEWIRLTEFRDLELSAQRNRAYCAPNVPAGR